MQLSEQSQTLKQIGVGIVTVTYDKTTDAKTFADRNQIEFPILQDESSDLIKLLGILNTGPKPGDAAYGIPYPGIFLIDRDGKIVAKFAEESYRDRPDFKTVIAAAREMAR